MGHNVDARRIVAARCARDGTTIRILAGHKAGFMHRTSTGVTVSTATLHAARGILAACPAAFRILRTPNAGGDSVFSEAAAYEVLHRMFGARLVAQEMEVPYRARGGPMVDFLASVRGAPWAVSVTRCFHGAPEMRLPPGKKALANRDARLLTRRSVAGLMARKIAGLALAADAIEVPGCGKVLLVWVRSGRMARGVRRGVRTAARALGADASGIKVLVLVTDLEPVFARGSPRQAAALVSHPARTARPTEVPQGRSRRAPLRQPGVASARDQAPRWTCLRSVPRSWLPNPKTTMLHGKPQDTFRADFCGGMTCFAEPGKRRARSWPSRRADASSTAYLLYRYFARLD
ncbi:hypothetical protein DFJ74DRAFT_652625 [Hyaloraphidium curvatum]|nr:hypothetical protein DFJ74DRAFT_652625 [Hyaloraphidium curvatum]